MNKKFHLTNRYWLNIVWELHTPTWDIVGTAVIQHGYWWTKEQPHIVCMQDVLLRHNFQVVNFDATHSFGESDGQYIDARLWLHTEDFEDVVEWTKQQDRYTGKLLVWWHSMWWYAASRYACRFDVDYLASFAPVVSWALSFEAHKKSDPKELAKREKDGVRIRESKSMPWLMKESPRAQMTERLDHDLLSEPILQSPALVIVWSEDDWCLPEHMKLFYDTIDHLEKKFVTVDWAPHTFRSQEHIYILDEQIDIWLQEVM